jgi:sulfide:quinone oxidoreductase
MKPIVVSDSLAVGEFPSPEEIEILAKAGFKSIVNNQPDGEVERFEGSAAVAGAARRHGLAHAYAPISSRTPPDEELSAFAAALATLPAPIYAFCYSGARSAAAAALLRTADTEPAALIEEFAAAGHDIAFLAPWLAELRARHVPAGASNGTGANGNGHAAEPAAKPAPALPSRTAEPAAAARALQGIVVHARARGAGGFAMVNHAH